MVQINFLALIVASFIPLIMGFIWYNPKVMGTAWMKEAEMTEDKMKGANMAMIFILSFVFSFFMAFMLQPITIHQFGALGMIGGDESLAKPSYTAFMADYGTAFRSFGHGALHSAMLGVLIIFPIIAINGMFERKSWKYIFINSGYWLITLILMGGIICGWYEMGHFNLVTPK